MTAKTLAVGVLLATLLVPPAFAGETAGAEPGAKVEEAAPALPDVKQSPLQPNKFVESLGVVPFRGDSATLVSYRRDLLAERYRTRILATPDVRERDLLAEEQEEQVEAFRKSHVEFMGQRTGYDVSILSGEFRHNARQAMRVVVEDDALVYFLISEDALWKVIYQMPAEGKDFAEIFATAKSIYGKPARVKTRTVYREGEPVEVPEEAVWDQGGLRFVLRDQAALYRAYVAKWLVADVEDEVAGGAYGAGDMSARFKTGDDLREVMGPDDPDVDDIVDRLLEGRE